MIMHLFQQLAGGPRIWEGARALRGLAVMMFLGFLLLLVIGIALLWRRGGGTGGAGARVDEAVTTLRLRYANGEIAREEFLQANQDLGGPPPPAPPVVPHPPAPPVAPPAPPSQG